VKLGIIARCDNTGLGNQTFELVKMLNPEKIMLIDSSSFHTGHQQHFEWYQGKNYSIIKGVPDKNQIVRFIQGLDIVLSCETFYSKYFVQIAKYKKVKTVLQYNFEFLQYLQTQEKFLPDMLLGPTVWNIDVIKEKFGNICQIDFLPPPTDHKNFKENKNINLKNHNRLLHVAGKAAAHDRNGTKIVLEMMKYAKSNFELVIKSQTPIDFSLNNDERIEVLISNKKNREGLYNGFDAMVLPRRYGGLCLPMNEALLSGIPTFMPDISPNNYFLPKEWLANSKVVGEFMTKTKINLNEVDPRTLAFMIDNYFDMKDKTSIKKQAYEIGYNNFSPDVLKDKYLNTLQSVLT
jgi:hypothetical protein